MSTSSLFKSLLLAMAIICPNFVIGQAAQWQPPKDLITAARGTGRTTGHIATLSVKNNAAVSHSLDLGMFFIPSEGRFQSYVSFPQPEIITVEPGTTVEIPIQGVCVNVDRPPVPSSNTLPPTSDWLVATGDMNPDMPPAFSYDRAAVSVVPRPSGGISVVNIPIGLTNNPTHTVVIDAQNHPATTAQFLFDAVTRIQSTTEQMQSIGAIRTPFANDPDKELEAIVQQTVWIYSSALSGEEYTKDQFAERLESQYAETSGTPITEATKDQKDQFNSGVDQFWNTFELVGMEAKVISVNSDEKVKSAVDDKAAEKAAGGVSGVAEDIVDDAESAVKDVLNPPQAPPAESTEEKEEENLSCECGEVFLNLRVESEDGSFNKSQDITADSGDRDDVGKFDATAAGGKAGDEFNISISDLNFECTCIDTPCQTYITKKTLSREKRPGAKSGTVRISSAGGNCEVVRNNDDFTEIGVRLSDQYDASSDGYWIHLVIEAICETANCDPAHCYAYIKISFSQGE